MTPIYLELIERVNNGETFYVDFEKRTMKVGKEYLIKNGEYETSRKLFDETWKPCEEFHSPYAVLHIIEKLYNVYKYSLPSERSDNKRKKYFKALSIDEISDELLMTAERREVAQAKLEGCLLCLVLEGHFKWDEISNGWFYQSVRDPDFVILRQWVEKEWRRLCE